MAMTPQDVAAMMQQILGTVLPTIMEQVTRSQTEAMQRMTDIANEAKKRDRGIHDSKAISKINTFKGQKDEDFTDWYYKVMSLMQCESEGTYKMMMECEKHSSPITHNIIKASSTYGEEGVKRDKLLYNFLVQNTEDTAAAIVRATDNCGSEAWRALCNRYDPKTAESRRKLMKRMSNMKQAKNLEELEGKIREMEKIVRKWEAASNRTLDEDLQVANITSICPNNMQSWLDMNTDDSDDYETVRKHIDRMIQKDIERTGPSPMDVSGVHEYQEPTHVHAAGQDHGHGGHQDYDLGAVAPGTVCYNCGGAGHMASTCSTPKGAGKGGGKKGDGKGDYKGKGKGDYKGKGKGGWNQYQAPIGAGPYKGNDKGDGKGKGKGKPINGNCNACGAWGHMARDCWSTAGKGTGVSQVEQSEYFEPYSTDAIYSSEEYMMTLALDASDYGSVKPRTGWKTVDNKVHQKYYEMFEGFMSIEEANTYDQSRSRQEKTKFGNTRTSTYNMFTALQETEALEMNSTVTTHNDMAEALEKNSTVTTPDDMAETLEKNSTVTNPIWTATALCSNLTGISPGMLHGCSAEQADQRFINDGFTPHELVPGRALCVTLHNGPHDIHLVNIHNHGLSFDKITHIEKFLEKHHSNISVRGGSQTTWLAGDWNCLAGDEVPLRIKDLAQAPVQPQDQQRHLRAKRWNKIFEKFVEFHSPEAVSRFDSTNSSFSRLDRIYTNIDRWALPLAAPDTVIFEAPDILHARLISDHSPVGIVLGKGVSKPKHMQAISPHIFTHPKF